MAQHDFRRQGEFDQYRRPPSPYGERGPARTGAYRGGNEWQGDDDGGRAGAWLGNDDMNEGYGGYGGYGGYTEALGGDRGAGGYRGDYGDRSYPQRGRGTQQGGFGEREHRGSWGHESQGMGREDGGSFGQQRGNRQAGPAWQETDEQQQRQEFDADYRQWRSDQVRSLDNDYRSWRNDRYKKFSEEFASWRKNRGDDTQRSGSEQTGGDTGTLSAANKETKDGPKGRV